MRFLAATCRQPPASNRPDGRTERASHFDGQASPGVRPEAVATLGLLGGLASEQVASALKVVTQVLLELVVITPRDEVFIDR